MPDPHHPPPRDVVIACADGERLAGTWFDAAAGGAVATVVIAAAMGVPRQFYARFAAFLASAGFHTLTFDYRGIGDSRLAASAGRVTLSDWGTRDLEAVLCAASGRCPDHPLFFVGHSVAGQLVGLAPASERLAGLVFVAASLPHWRLWPGVRRYALAAAWYLIVPALSAGSGMFPARRFGFSSVDIPSGVTRQWACWGRHRRCLFAPELGIDVERYRRLGVPLRAYVFDDDGYCPEAAARALLAELPRTEQTLVCIAAAEHNPGGIGHFGFFREKMRDVLWDEVAAWLRERSVSRASRDQWVT